MSAEQTKRKIDPTSGNSSQAGNIANGNISPLTSFTHSDRYRFGSISNIEFDDELGEREQYNYFIGATDKLASWGSEGKSV